MNANLKFNLPQKVNFKGLSGTDALTGASNFDICEYIILKLIEGSIGKNVSIAMLCKTSVARNVLLELDRNDVPVDLVRMYTFDSLKVFRINASACLLYIKMSTDDSKCRNCEVYDINYPDHVCETISFKNGRLCSVKEDVPDLEGKCCFEWRQGVKHDCARLMELEKTGESCYDYSANNLRIYGEFVYVFSDYNLVTVMLLPNDLKDSVKKIMNVKRKVST